MHLSKNKQNYLHLVKIFFPIIGEDIFLLLEHVSGKSFFTNLNTKLEYSKIQILYLYIKQVLDGVPVCYITKRQYFYNTQLKITKKCFIPRSDSECIIETVRSLSKNQEIKSILDLGTGSGAMGIALSECIPQCKVVGVDIDKAALKVAKINKKRLKIKNFFIFYSNWFDNISSMYDVIIANPPYLDFSQKDFSPDILYEPHKALFAQNNGLLELQKIITRSVKFCKKYLIVEHNPEQQQQVHDFFNQAGYTNMQAILNIKHNAQATIGEKSDI